MYNLVNKNEILKTFIQDVERSVDSIKVYGDLAEFMRKDDASMVKSLLKTAEKTITGLVPEGIKVPEITVYSTLSGNENMIRVIDLKISNKYNAKFKFSFKKQIIYSEKVLDEVIEFFTLSYNELITHALIEANLEVVNEKLAEITKEAGNTYKVSVVSPLGYEGKKIASITDDEVVFVADEERALLLDDILVFCQPSEFLSEETIKHGFDTEVGYFAQAQTTPQLVGVHDPLIGYVCAISTLIKPLTLIKKVYTKNIKKVKGNKEVLAYYLEDKVFSVISVNEDGKSVALKPFDTETLEVVDFDVLEAIA